MIPQKISQPNDPATILTIGNFDGVHRGHRALVESLNAWKRGHGGGRAFRSVVMTFDPHPIEVLRPGTRVPRLSSSAEKRTLLLNLGIDLVQVVPFTTEFSRRTARDFFEDEIIKWHQPAFVAIGHNFFFGRNREGTPELMVKWCEQFGIEARIIEPLEADGAPISSSRIRKLIQDGQMTSAARLLGRDYSITGEVVHGNKKGRLLGFPTANVAPRLDDTETAGHSERCVPAPGVYLSSASFDGRTFPSITNVGYKPTVQSSGPLMIETHLLDFDDDVYGKQLTVEFRDRIRAEQKFGSLDELKLQIQKDTETARARLRHN